MLTREQIETYQQKGFLRIPGVYREAEVEAMRTDLDQLLQDWATTNAGWSGPWRQVYMSPDVEQRSTLTHLHDLHFYSSAWNRAAANPRLTEATADLLGESNVELHHTTLHLKPPEAGMPFPLHQDSPFYRHEGAYIDAVVHLDDTNDENGCLRFVPGSHANGHIEHITEVDGTSAARTYRPIYGASTRPNRSTPRRAMWSSSASTRSTARTSTAPIDGAASCASVIETLSRSSWAGSR